MPEQVIQTLEEYLNEAFRERGAQARFSRATGIESGTVTKWKEGKPADFVSCLRIARFFKEDPERVFDLAGKPEFKGLYRPFFPRYQKQDLSETDLYASPTDAEIHRRIQQLLDAGMGLQADSLTEDFARRIRVAQLIPTFSSLSDKDLLAFANVTRLSLDEWSALLDVVKERLYGPEKSELYEPFEELLRRILDGYRDEWLRSKKATPEKLKPAKTATG